MPHYLLLPLSSPCGSCRLINLCDLLSVALGATFDKQSSLVSCQVLCAAFDRQHTRLESKRKKKKKRKKNLWPRFFFLLHLIVTQLEIYFCAVFILKPLKKKSSPFHLSAAGSPKPSHFRSSPTETPTLRPQTCSSHSLFSLFLLLARDPWTNPRWPLILEVSITRPTQMKGLVNGCFPVRGFCSYCRNHLSFDFVKSKDRFFLNKTCWPNI